MTPVIAGKYELLRRLGKGGMAEVFLAKQTGIDGFEKLVVIKRILPHLSDNEDFVTMFLDEARTAADLRHPNVVNIFEIGQDEGTYHMVMEFLHGQDIRKIQRQSVRSNTPIPLAHALQIVLDAANGLYHAHTKKDLAGNKLSIIHRDISPQNIITTYDGATKIVDFGIAKAATQNTETQTGVVKGKYTYMAPEQAQGEVLDHRTDQFALGIVMWELITMRRLFKRENEIMTLAAITEGDVPRPSEFVEIPETLDNIIMKVLAKNRDDRFKDCQDMMLAIEDFLAESRMPHSPARLGAFMKTLFADTINDEADLGVGQLDGSSITGLSVADRTAAGGRRGRSRSSANESLSAAVKQEHDTAMGDAGAPTAMSASYPALRQDAVDDAETPPTTPRGQVGGALAPTGGTNRTPLIIGLAASLFLVFIAVASLLAVVSGETGEIIVKTSPQGATVFVDGVKQRESTPMVLKDVPVGEAVTIEVKKDGYESFSFSASVPKEGAKTSLQTDLEPAPAEPDDDAAKKLAGDKKKPTEPKDEPKKTADAKKPVDGKPTGGVAAAGAKAATSTKSTKATKSARNTSSKKDTKASSSKSTKKETKKERRPGTLKINVKPWAKVYIDGEYIDLTPIPPQTLKAGTHTIKLINQDKGKSVTKRVTIKPGGTARINLDWR